MTVGNGGWPEHGVAMWGCSYRVKFYVRGYHVETKYYLETFPGRYAALAQGRGAFEPEVQALVEPSRDLMGGVHAHTVGYVKRLKVGPWYVSAGDEVYAHLRWILDRGLVMDALRTSLLAVRDGSALRREACLEITGADEGRIAFCLHFTGREQEGTFTDGRFRHTEG